jgi:hypothetical protein
VPSKILVTTLALAATLLAGCSQEPAEEKIIHPESLSTTPWLRSKYEIVGREAKEFGDHSGWYVVLTIRHGKKRITAECSSTWISQTGEDMPSTMVPYDHCGHLPMGSVELERTDWNNLYYFSGSGKHREEIAMAVKKMGIR